jgi:hypothetical protein
MGLFSRFRSFLKKLLSIYREDLASFGGIPCRRGRCACGVRIAPFPLVELVDMKQGKISLITLNDLASFGNPRSL